MPLPLRYRFRFIQGVFVLMVIFSLAMILTYQNDLRNRYSYFEKYASPEIVIKLKILEPLQEKSKSNKTIACIQNVILNNQSKPTKGLLLLYLQKSKKSESIQYGSVLMTNKSPLKIKSVLNPGDFDNAKYQSQQQIYHQLFLRDSDYVILEKKEETLILKTVFFLRAGVLHILEDKFNDKKIRGIAEALLIGYKNNLDQELVQSYSNTGVVHIIAISGLHLGLIYVVLLWVFGKLPYIRKKKWMRYGAVLVCLWLFALITGASASVLRSAVMFSCIILGEFLQKKSSVYNSLAASAFLMLCYNPLFIFDIGFQLSYLAILGIVMFQKPIEHLLDPKQWLLRKLNEMVSITIAAQIMTFPVCLFYFHQFPVFFLITNLIAVPLSTFILFAEIGLIVFYSIPFMGNGLTMIIGKSIGLLNQIISGIDSISFSSIKNIHADFITTVLLYFLVFSIVFFINQKNRVYLKFFLVLITLFTSFNSYAKFKNHHQRKIVIYNKPRHQAIHFINGENYTFVGDSVQVFKNAIKLYGLKTETKQLIGLKNSHPLINYFNKKMIIIDSSYHFVSLDRRVDVDILLLSKSPSISIADILKSVNPKLIVIDGSNKKRKTETWKRECDNLNIKCYLTNKDGAYLEDLN